MQSAARGRCNGWIELRPEQAWSMGSCAWQAAEAEFEGGWGSNSTGQGGVCTRNGWLLSRALSARSLNGGLMLPILIRRLGLRRARGL